MLKPVVARPSLYVTLGVILVSTILVIMTMQSAYTYSVTKRKTYEDMKKSVENSSQKLRKNISGFMASYEANEYDKIVRTEMEHNNFAIVVEDYNLGKIIGEQAYISGRMRGENNEIIEYDDGNIEHKKRLKESFYSKEYDITDNSDRKLGVVRIYKSGERLKKELNNIVINSLFDTVTISLLLILSLFFSIRIFLLKPLSNITNAIENCDKDGIPLQLIPWHGSREIDALSITINRMIDTIKDSRVTLTEQHNELKSREDQLQTLSLATEQSPVSILICDQDKIIEYVNPQFAKTSGFTASDVTGTSIKSLYMEMQLDPVQVERLEQTLEQGERWIGEMTALTRQGDRYSIRMSASPLLIQDGSLTHYIYVAEDITEIKKNEQILRNTQKMDALGKLTGGIAHDYNNLLGIIQGYSEQLNEHLEHDSKLSGYSRDIQHAAERGARLTKKLLSFSRNNAPDLSVFSVSTLLKEQQNMLEKTLTARYKLTLNLEEDLWLVKLDSNELEDAVVNMSINAVYAMNQSGELTLEARNKKLDESSARGLQLKAGEYVLLTVTDTGCGMDEAIRERVFDPFYTTKGERGTGLGLSQVYGFVERSGGAIRVYSEPEKGSCFSLYFPKFHGVLPEIRDVVKIQHRDTFRGTETLLVVDDEPAMTSLANDIFTARGYHVLTANSGEQALAMLEKNSVDLLVSDVIMPGMDGYQLVAKVKQQYPHIKLQMVSGYSDERHRGFIDEKLHQNMLHKPYTSRRLLSHIRNILDGRCAEKTLEGRMVLVVDDEVDAQELFRLGLKKLGCLTTVASNGDEAIELFRQSLDSDQFVEVVIMDLSLPGCMDGTLVAKEIRTLSEKVKIIISSGHSDGPEMMNYSDYGFDGALEKNFNREKMEQVLEQVLA